MPPKKRANKGRGNSARISKEKCAQEGPGGLRRIRGKSGFGFKR